MKKLLFWVIAFAMLSGTAFAADNQSAAYIRMLSREALTDSIDIAYFNPAGTVFLKPGFHVQFNNQFVYLKYSHKALVSIPQRVEEGKEYSSEKFNLFVPSGYFGYNSGKWAAFLSHTIPSGGGSLYYEKGSFLLASQGIDAFFGGSSAVHGISLGGAYKITDMISISLLGTFYYGVNMWQAEVRSNEENLSLLLLKDLLVGKAESRSIGTGFGGTFGIHTRPIDNLDISVTVEAGQKIEMEVKEVSGDLLTIEAAKRLYVGFTEGETYSADRPWRIRTGVAYTFPFGLTVPVSFKYDFWKALDEEKRNTYSVAMAFLYGLFDDTLKVSLGTSYDIDEIKKVEDYDQFDPELASFTIAGGISWEFIDNLVLDIGTLYPFYLSEKTDVVEYNKQVINIAMGIGYTF